MLAFLRRAFARWFDISKEGERPLAGRLQPASEFLLAHIEDERDVSHILLSNSAPIPYDENLLGRATTQWQFGDWQSLSKHKLDTLQYHPDRAIIALLVAAGHLQSDNISSAKQFIRLAQDWGCNKKIVARTLAAGVHNSLGRAAAITGEHERALRHFRDAIETGAPGSDTRLLLQARANEQLAQLDLTDINEKGKLSLTKQDFS